MIHPGLSHHVRHERPLGRDPLLAGEAVADPLARILEGDLSGSLA